MKKLKKSFLFFCFTVSSCLGLLSSVAFGQQTIDSAAFFREKMVNPKSSDDLNEAYIYYENQIKENLKRKDTITAITNLRLLAIGEYNLGFLHESDESAIKALALVDALDINETTAEIKKALNNQLGKIYKALNNYDKALDYYDRALAYSMNMEDSILIRNNKAFVYIEQDKNEAALLELNEVYKKRRASTNKKELARALDNLSFVQGKVNHPEALPNALSAIELRLEINDNIGLFSSYRHLTHYYLDRNKKEEALQYATKGYEIASSLNSVSYLQEARSLFIALNDNPQVLEYKRVEDSISKAKQLMENKFAGMKYDLSKEKEKTEANKLLTEKQKRRALLYQSIGAFTILAGIFLYFLLRARHKKEKLQQIYNTETRISKKVHDEVANDVYHVIAMVQANTRTQEEILDDLEEIYTKTRDISKENSAIEVRENYEVLLQDLLVSYKTSDVNIITRNIAKINWNSISDTKKTVIYRVLQELMTNMRKHSKASLAVLTFAQNSTKIAIEYTDNGKGCKFKKGNGLQNTENRIQTVNGRITFESEVDKGFKVKIEV